MKIAIDISQLAHENTGVANYLRKLVQEMIRKDRENEYVLFYASLRKPFNRSWFDVLPDNVSVKTVKIPPTILTRLWNQMHMIPLETFTGPVDIFISSDWAEPPTQKAKKMTIIYDMIIYKYPKETHNMTEFNAKTMRISANIVQEQEQRLKWVKKESDHIFAISEATKRDIVQLLKIDQNKISVIYPGL